MKRTDVVIIQKIIGYCDDISSLLERFNTSYELYLNDIAFQYACNMRTIQIGELTNRLSVELKAETPDVPWYAIRAMRNIHAHDYERVDFETMWETLTQDIPVLKVQLTALLAKSTNG